MWGLYDRLNLRRIYFSAYQKIGDSDSNNLFTPREHLSAEAKATCPPKPLKGEGWKTDDQSSTDYRLSTNYHKLSTNDYQLSTIDASFVREHRLYQVDFLLRKYGFSESDIIFDQQGNLPLDTDPKESWAKRNPQYFPVDINKASKDELLRVPGLGQITVERIIELRKSAKIKTISDLGKSTSLLTKANDYLAY